MALSLSDIEKEISSREQMGSSALGEIDAELKKRGVTPESIFPEAVKEAYRGSQDMALKLSALPRDAMRTFATTAANAASGVRPDIALAEAAMTQMRPDATQTTPQEKVASLGADVMDPRMMMANPLAGEVMKGAVIPAAKGVGRQLARLQNVLTGVPVEDITKMAEKPIEVMTSKTVKGAGNIFQKAKDAAGVTELEERLIAGIGDPSGYKKVADVLAEKAADGTITTGEALAWKKAAGELSRKAKGSARFIYGKDAAKAQKILLKQAPEVAKTQADVALSKIRSKFLNVLPLNKGGTPAVVRTLLAGGIGMGVNPALAPAFSPLANLPATLAAGGVNKGLNVLGNNPAIRQALLGILQNIQRNKK